MRWHTQTGLGTVAFGNSDEFGAERLASRCLAGILDGGPTPAAVRPWPESLDHGHRIDRALREAEPLDAIDSVFAENVLLDVPPAVRHRRLAAMLDMLGPIEPSQRPLSARIRPSASAADLSWTIRCRRGTLLCDIRLIGLHAPLVQALAVEVADAAVHEAHSGNRNSEEKIAV
jgi:hypothetical protein